MSHVPYEYDHPDNAIYIFVSRGKKNIEKVVEFVPMELPNVMNLGFGDLLPDGSIDYETISNNGDIIKVLSTVIEIIKHFTSQHPKTVVLFTGSTVERTRLYARILRTYYSVFVQNFLVFGVVKLNDRQEAILFDPLASIDYLAFLIKRND